MTLSAEDKWDALALVTTMYRALDAKDPATYAGSFTQDGTFSHPYGQMSGRNEVRAWVENHIAQGHQEGGRHCVVNAVVEEDPAGACVKCYVLRMKVDIDPLTIMSGGLEATLVRHGSKWLVRHQKVMVDAMPDA